jgi:hypothetical protein
MARRARKAEEGTGLDHLALVAGMIRKGLSKLNTVEAFRKGMGGDTSKEVSRL